MIKKISVMLLCLSGMVLAMEQQQAMPEAKQRKLESEAIKVVYSSRSLKKACYRAILKVLFEGKLEEVFAFLNETCKDLPNDLIFSLIDEIIVYNALLKVFEQTELRLGLAHFCVMKSMEAYASNHPDFALLADDDNRKTDYLNTIMATEPGDHLPYAKKALAILEDMLKDPFFQDKAQLQPFAHLWFIERGFAAPHYGYTSLQKKLAKMLKLDEFFHSICQVIIQNEQEVLELIKRVQAPPYELLTCKWVTKQLWQWAELFGRSKLMLYLEQFLTEAELHGMSSLPTDDDVVYAAPTVHRALYSGDVTRLESRGKITGLRVYGITDASFFKRKTATLLETAAQLGYTKVVEFLLALGATEEIQKAREKALAYGHTAVLKLLCNKETSFFGDLTAVSLLPELSRALLMGYTDALKYALAFCTPKTLSLLICRDILKPLRALALFLDALESSACDTQQKELILRHALCVAIENRILGTLEVAEQLLKRPIPLNVSVKFDSAFFGNFVFLEGTPLEKAVALAQLPQATESNLKLIELLIQKGARDVPNEQGLTLLAETTQSLATRRMMAQCAETNGTMRNSFQEDPKMNVARLEAIVKMLAQAQEPKRLL